MVTSDTTVMDRGNKRELLPAGSARLGSARGEGGMILSLCTTVCQYASDMITKYNHRRTRESAGLSVNRMLLCDLPRAIDPRFRSSPFSTPASTPVSRRLYIVSNASERPPSEARRRS